MLRLTIVSAALVWIALLNAKMLKVRKTHDPGSCSEFNHGEMILVKNRENRDMILVCTEDDEVYSWIKTDNSKPHGEFFNPGYDCLDILNKNTKSKDGYYWVDFDLGKPKKVYCDMTTDGGGYILFGYLNDTAMWAIPSNNRTVKPFDDSHWSSEFGNVPILDFRVQIATGDDFEKTRAHWAFRFKDKRRLRNLMIAYQGCPRNFPGIGDVSSVKDLITNEIVSKEFSCSIFGSYSYPVVKGGSTKMNRCLRRPCQYGLAYPWKRTRIDFSGGFSYGSRGYSSNRRSTAFFGCERGKCCACYGPRGGRNIYCLRGCRSTNGGTVIKRASAWLWVRLNPPEKVWAKCMEYWSERKNGVSGWYKLEGDRNIPVQGRCGKSEPLMNDGVVVVENLMNVPEVTGLLAFRMDNQTLNVRGNETWKALAEEEKVTQDVSQINDKLTNMKKRLNKLEIKTARNFRYWKVLQSDVWKLVARFSNRDKKNWMIDASFWYDQMSSYGNTQDPSVNQDMISEAFWKTHGNEIKITRSDDPTHTALLQTTNGCLGGKTFREFITSFGNFRNGNTWSYNKCLSKCAIKYGGLYRSTTGFEMNRCSSDLQSSNYIGFWCYWRGDGVVMMIGGGGSRCGRADHGIGITEADSAIFGEVVAYADFGYEPGHGYYYVENNLQRGYALNLWVH